MSLFFHYYHRIVLFRGILLFTLFAFSLNVTVSAAIVTTNQTVNSNLIDKFNSLNLDISISRAAIEQQLVAYGVAPDEVSSRLDSMTDNEIAALSAEISELPAGGEVLVIIAVVFLVLLFTDIAGYTDLFPFVNKSESKSKDAESEKKESKEPLVIEN
ncbi:MAG: PA2779 family protein [Thiohalomonadales bacterium]